MSTPPQPNVILIADDDADDLFLVRRLIAKAGIKNPLVSCPDGDEVLAFLRPAATASSKAIKPLVVFLDIKMPKLNGFEVLRWIRKQAAFKLLPVVMLSGSDEPRDIKRAAELGATRYLIKHPTAEEFAKLLVECTTRP
jgi:CheY-like chemotaxis protein